jgi:hypothetical protein
MRKYQVTVQADRYPMTWTVEATSYAVALARALRLWQKRFKRSRADILKITVVRGGIIEKED